MCGVQGEHRVAFRPNNKSSENANKFAGQRTIKRSKQASKRSADATQNGKKKRAGSPDPAKPTKQSDIRARDPKTYVKPSK